jgi:phage replication initiation protein
MTRPAKASLVTDGNTIKVRLEAERLETGSLVHVDWLRFTVRLRNAPALRTDVPVKSDNIWDEGYRLAEIYKLLSSLPDCERDSCGQAAELADRVSNILGPDFSRALSVGKGHDFYRHRWPILRNDVECGWVGFGASSDSPRQTAQASTIHVNLFGAACTFASFGWREKLADLCDELSADITRCDLALDCWRRSKFDHLCRLNFDQGLRLSC